MMNETTRQNLELMTVIFSQGPFAEEMVPRGHRLLAMPMPLDDGGLTEFFQLLHGPLGCDFREEDGAPTWECAGGSDKSKAKRILREEMEVSEADTEYLLDLVDFFGGHCDCEILMNAAPRMLPDVQPRDGRRTLVVLYDVSDLTDEQREVLEGEALVQGELSKGDGLGGDGHPPVVVTSATVLGAPAEVATRLLR